MTLNKLTDINKHFIGIALLLIPLVGSLAIPPHSHDLNITEKIMIQNILSTLFTSICWGFVQIAHEYGILKFYNYQNSKRAETLYDNQNKSYKKAIELADEYRIKGNFLVYSFFSFPFALVIEGYYLTQAIIQISHLVNSFLGI
jgi:hypothetical protein